jgi:hypothetical protein
MCVQLGPTPFKGHVQLAPASFRSARASGLDLVGQTEAPKDGVSEEGGDLVNLAAA